MKRAICEREDQTAAAVCSGTVTLEITSHARQCAACAEVLLVAELLQESSTLADHERIEVPDAGVIWNAAQTRASQDAVRIALRPIRFMKIIAVVAFACSPWLGMVLPAGREIFASWSRGLDFNFAFASKIWLLMASESTIFLASTGTLILLGLSSWYMLRQE